MCKMWMIDKNNDNGMIENDEIMIQIDEIFLKK